MHSFEAVLWSSRFRFKPYAMTLGHPQFEIQLESVESHHLIADYAVPV
jgi:hypothetical protein